MSTYLPDEIDKIARDQILERPLPNSAEAERAIIGAIILDNGIWWQAREVVYPQMFYVPFFREAFTTMDDLAEMGMEINQISVGEELRRRCGYTDAVTTLTQTIVGLPTNIGFDNSSGGATGYQQSPLTKMMRWQRL
jgi:hypothetical protein